MTDPIKAPITSIATYKDAHGNDVRLSIATVKNYLGLAAASDQECVFFITMAKASGLNPFLHEIYGVKYQNQPMYTVVAYQEFVKRAAHSGHYKGFKVTIENDPQTHLPVKGTCVVKRDDRDEDFQPTTAMYFNESAKMFRSAGTDHKAGELMSTWAVAPHAMFEKALIKRAHMLAFPEDDVMGQLGASEANAEVEQDSQVVEGAGTVQETVKTQGGVTIIESTGETVEDQSVEGPETLFDPPATDDEKVNVAAICAYMKWSEEALAGELQRAKAGVTTLDQLTHGCYVVFMKDWRNWAGIWGFELTAEGMPVQAAPVVEPKATPKK
jgi:hypothetical protein